MAKKNKMILIIVVVVVVLVALVLLWFLFGRGGGNGDKKKMRDALTATGIDDKTASCYVDKLVDSVGMDNAKKMLLDSDRATLAKYAGAMKSAGKQCA